ASSDEELGHVSVMGGRRDMQGGVARVHVVMDRDEEERMGVLPARADVERTVGHPTSSLEHPTDLGVITSSQCREQRTHRTVIAVVGPSTRLRHEDSMLDRER